MQIRPLTAIDKDALAGLSHLLCDCVNNGASIGFLAPLPTNTAHYYWTQVFKALEGSLYLWVAESEGKILGSVQLNVCTKDNGRHRAELQKLMVLSTARGQGIAKHLLKTAEDHAKHNGLLLLILDTEQGSAAECVYQHLGWEQAGVIPDYATTPDGRLHPTVYYFKHLLTISGETSSNSSALATHRIS